MGDTQLRERSVAPAADLGPAQPLFDALRGQAGQRGHPFTYAAVYDLVGRLRRRTGIDFDPHWCRHTYATALLRAGTPVEVVSRLLRHASVITTIEVYGHLSV
jgi:integrase/recombinase XerD